MSLTFSLTKARDPEWRDALSVAFTLGTQSIFNIEWLIDRAERGEWGGLWW